MHANRNALTRWRQSFGDALGVALTDTFGTDTFLDDFGIELARQYAGVRHDSGNPERFAQRIVEHYTSCGIDSTTKTIVFSDSLDASKCIELNGFATERGIKASFGIGTYLTNDFRDLATGEKSRPMNIVIKLSTAAGRPAIKISDDM